MLRDEEPLTKVLHTYAITPLELTRKGTRTFFVRDHSQSYMVRKVEMSIDQRPVWEAVFHDAYRHDLHEILPVYKTNSESLYVAHEHNIYYVTPYVEKDENSTVKEVFTTIGNIHAKTKRIFLIRKDTFISAFEAYEQEIKSMHVYLRQCIDLFEQQHYMSPIELQVCTHFHTVDYAIQQCMTHIASMLNICKRDEKEHIEWATSLCHQMLSSAQLLHGNAQYIKNWEHAAYANATTDIIQLCKKEFTNNTYPLEQYVDGLCAYDDIYNFSDLEFHLLSLHLLDPLPYIKAVQSYVQQPKEKPITSHVIGFERMLRLVSNSAFMLQGFQQRRREKKEERV